MIYRFSRDLPLLLQNTSLDQIRKVAYPPFKWCQSPLWPIDKRNGKPKCKGKRPVAGVCPFPRAYMRAKLKKTIPVKHYAYGAVKSRRREEAIGVSMNCKKRCLKAGKSHAQVFHDAAGAFNSLEHEAIYYMLLRSQTMSTSQFFSTAHAKAHLTIEDEGTWRITRGTLPGHSIAGDMFVGTYDVGLEGYLQVKEKEEEQIVYEGTQYDMSITTFVDDIGEFIVFPDPEDAHRKATANTEALKSALSNVGCTLEPSKERVVPRMMGRGAVKAQRNIMKKGMITDGEKVPVARYQGAWPQANGHNTTDVSKHCSAMKTGFYAFAGVWSCSSLPFNLKRMFFLAIVVSAGLSGLEPLFLLPSELDRLESVRMLLLRRLFGRTGWGKVKNSPDHQSVSDVNIRKRAQMHTFGSTLRMRRLQWFRSMLLDEQYHSQYLASLLGKFEWERHEQLVDGAPHSHSLDVLRQLYDDLSMIFPGFVFFFWRLENSNQAT